METILINNSSQVSKQPLIKIMKAFILLLCTTVFSFNVENSFSQEESIIIDQDQQVSVDQVFKIIKEQTEYSFMYPKELFKNSPKVQLKKGEIKVVKLLKQSLSDINFNFQIINLHTIIITKKDVVNHSKKKRKLQSNEIKGSVFDETTDEPLSYATIRLLGTKYYTITNEDGKFEFSLESTIKVDSLEVRFLGFEKKRVSISFFKSNTKLYLRPHISSIDEVLITSKKNNKKDKKSTYNLLYSVIEKYRKDNTSIKSKAFLSLVSSARSVPIEHIEGFYNSKQSLSNGILDLDIKSGRFGQNKQFSYYSLDNTTILKDFQLFNKSEEQILPLYPGNLSLIGIKSKYNVTIEYCSNCEDNDVLIAFSPKKPNQRLFNGNIIFNKRTLTIKKIELKISNPKTLGLSSISEKDIFTPQTIKLNVLFNPLDLSKIQHIDFEFDVLYTSTTFSELIKSRTFLYFYDYKSEFEKPIFTKEIGFKNDYDKIVALQASDEFWNLNYQFPKSYNDQKYMRFMEEHGYLINYESAIPLDYIEYVKPSVVDWNNIRRIDWNIIKHGLVEKIKSDDKKREYDKKTGINSDKESHSISEMNKISYKIVTEKLNFSYVFDVYKDINEDRKLTSRTIFDRNTSYSKKQRTRNKLIYINLIFDIYEYYRQSLDPQKEFSNQMTSNEIKKMFDDKFIEASETVKKMGKETSFGTNYQNLIRWNNKMNLRLNVDNVKLITKQND
jgi:hypothetical protein